MSLEHGTRVGPYEITGTLGVGGMGEVYRARDPRLARDVALKVLPEIFAADPERLARFQREAQVLAALKHSNIGAIYGLEESSDAGAMVRALVLELIEGETLADRIARGAIPVDEALPVARQIADALETAHERGVIHRDLKPANIKTSPDGVVKVLDFGLAKLTEAGGAAGASEARGAGNAHLSMSPTITSPAATGLGVILGTAAYMAPEQAKGRPADKRSDIWAFGCVLFEMLTGKRAFEADDISDTLALVLKGEPDWNALPADLSKSIRTLIRACLEKDRRQRIGDISSALFVLTHQADLTPPVVAPVQQPITVPRRPVWRRITVVVGLALAIAALSGAGVWLATRPEAPAAARFFVSPPENVTVVTGGRPATSAVISPDGRMLAFTARDGAGKVTLWVRPIDSLTAQPLAGTDNAQGPFGRRIAGSSDILRRTSY
jgi:eukaryotic-like serine/threonine-protein kinase